MFFIDHDQAKITEGQKQGRARTDHKAHATLGCHAPQAAAFGGGHARMPLTRLGAKARFDTGQKIAGQGDFGQKHQGLLAFA